MKLYDYAHIEPYEVADQNHWFTQEQINLFHEKLTEMTGSTNIAREAEDTRPLPNPSVLCDSTFLE